MKNIILSTIQQQAKMLLVFTIVSFNLSAGIAQICPDTLFTPRNITVCQGDAVTFDVVPTFPVANADITWSSGDITSSTTIVFSQSQYVSITVAKGELTCKDSVFVTVIQSPITITTTNTVICSPYTTSLKALPATSHQWFKNGFAIGGATGQVYTTSSGGNYYCIATNQCGNYSSNTITITSYSPPTLNVSLSSGTTLCTGDSIKLTGLTNAVNPTYTWFRNNILINNATTAELNVKQVGNYKLQVQDAVTTCTRKSSGVKIIASTLTSTITANPCNSGSVILNAGTNAVNPTYKWYRNNVLISSAIASTYTTSQTGFYKVIVKDLTGGCTKSSSSFNISSLCRYGSFNKVVDIVAYPNPFNSELNFDVSDDVEPAKLLIYNMLGKVVYENRWENKVDLYQLPAGLYIVEIRDHLNGILQRQTVDKQ